jgi:hypothetical protein
MSSPRSRRSAIVLVATVIGFGVSFVMLERVIGASSPWLGLLLMFYFLGLAKVAEPLYKLRLPGFLRALRPWERDGAVYRRLGVMAFGKLLRETPLRILNRAVYLTHGPRDLTRVFRLTESAEAAHFWAAVLFTPYIGYVWSRGHARVAAVFLLVQLSFNVYPILHLRIVRGRLDRFSRRVSAGIGRGASRRASAA